MQDRVSFLGLFWTVLIVPAGLLFPGIVSAEDQRAMLSKELSTADKVQVYLQVGIRYQDTRQWEKAAKNYEQALALDPMDVSAHRQIVRLYFDWHKHAWISGGVPTGPIREKAIDSLYKIQVLAPASQENKEMRDWSYKMFVEHVKYFRWLLHRRGNANNPKENDLLAAENVLQKQAVDSPNLERQCQLGLTRSILALLYKNKDNGHDILRQAVGLAPENGFCHEALAMALDMSYTVDNRAEALHEYVLAIQFLKGSDEEASQHRSSLATRGVRVISKARKGADKGEDEDLPIFSSLDLPLQKKGEILEFFIENNSENYRFEDGMNTVFPVVWLGNLYFEMGHYRLAEETFFEHAQTYQDRGLSQEVLARWIEALEKGGHNPGRLGDVRQKYEEKYGESSKGPSKKYRR